MIVSVVPIGNSKGIRLPKVIIDQLNILDKLDLTVENQQIILKPIKANIRDGWIESFKQMHQDENDHHLIDDSIQNEAFEWEW